MLKILAVGGHETSAIARFNFKGLVISASTVFPHAGDRILVETYEGRELFTCFQVEEAINWINQREESAA